MLCVGVDLQMQQSPPELIFMAQLHCSWAQQKKCMERMAEEWVSPFNLDLKLTHVLGQAILKIPTAVFKGSKIILPKEANQL